MLYVEAVVHSTKEHYIFRVSKGDVLEKVDASVRLDSIKEVSLGLYQNNEVDALLARIERIYQEVDEETQDYLMRLHSEFTKDMETLINNIQKRKRLINQVTQILNQIEESVDFFDTLVDYDLEMYRHKKMKTTPEVALKALKASKQTLEAFDQWDSMDALHECLLALPKELEMKNGQVLWPIRTAVSGKQFTPGGAIEIAFILGKDETLRRIQVGIDRLSEIVEE